MGILICGLTDTYDIPIGRIEMFLKKYLKRPGFLYFTYGRYRPVIKFISDTYGKNKMRVLDAGCGQYGIAEYLPYPVTGLDLQVFTSQPANLRYHIGSVLELPFRDDSFDIVLSCDMLEHLHPDDRKRALSEMLRVAVDFVLIACPVGSGSQKIDSLLYRWGRFFGIDDPALREHLAIPYIQDNEIDAYLQTNKLTYNSFHTENNLVHILLTLVIVTPGIRRIIPTLSKFQPFKSLFRAVIACGDFGKMWRKHYEISIQSYAMGSKLFKGTKSKV